MISAALPKNFDIEEFLKASDPENGNNSEKVYFHILKEIFRGGYKIGSRITEAQIVEKLKVSNGPVREALGRLRSDGWIETIPNIGSVIVNYRDGVRFQNVFKDRRIIELGCAVELAQTATFRQLAELESVVEDIERGLLMQDSGFYRESDLRFHYKIVEFIASHRLFNLWRHSTLQLFCSSYPGTDSEYLNNAADVKMQEASHRALFQMIAEHNTDETRRLYQMHLNFRPRL